MRKTAASILAVILVFGPEPFLAQAAEKFTAGQKLAEVPRLTGGVEAKEIPMGSGLDRTIGSVGEILDDPSLKSRDTPLENVDAVGQLIVDKMQETRSVSPESPRPQSADFPVLSNPPIPLGRSNHPIAGPKKPGIYLLSEPLEVTVKLGIVAKVLHYAIETAIQFLNAGILYWGTGNLYAACSFLAFELFKMPPTIIAQSLADLQLRYWWHKLEQLRQIAKTPGVHGIKILTTGETQFQGLVASQQQNRGLVILASAEVLAKEIPPLGTPIVIDNLESTKLKLALMLEQKVSQTLWQPSFKDLLEGQPIPAAIADAWRKDVAGFHKGKSWLVRLFNYSAAQKMKITASLISDQGAQTMLGTLMQGKSIDKLLGIGSLDKILSGLKRVIPGASRNKQEKNIPLSDTMVMRKGQEGSFLGSLWKRISGRLILI